MQLHITELLTAVTVTVSLHVGTNALCMAVPKRPGYWKLFSKLPWILLRVHKQHLLIMISIFLISVAKFG